MGNNQEINKEKEKNCFIWTRVSTKFQEDNGGSLANQKSLCEAYAQEHGYSIVGYYGGKHESAKTPGELIQKMLKAIKKDKTVSYIIVSECDRFSRNAGQGTTILDKLLQSGVVVVEAKTGLDTSTSAGLMMIQMKVCMSQWENTNRTTKMDSGIQNCMRNGIFIGHHPVGYDKEGRSIHTTYTINSTGKLIRKAFQWKLQNIPNNNILCKLANYNFTITKQRLHKILTNPFYAGKIVNKRCNYEIIEGNHPPIISYEEFLRVQEILSGRTGKYVHDKETPQFPLKHHVRCATDGTPFTAYSVKNKNKDYYKCNQIGCKTNVSANLLHKKYAELLNSFQIPKELLGIVKKLISNIIGDDDELKETLTLLRKNKTETENKIKNNKLRFADGTIDEDVFNTALKENQAKLEKILLEIDNVQKELSNSQTDVDIILTMCCKLGNLWENSSLQTCQKIQNLVFPEGIFWDKKISDYRTTKTNQALALIARICELYGDDQGDDQTSSVNLCG